VFIVKLNVLYLKIFFFSLSFNQYNQEKDIPSFNDVLKEALNQNLQRSFIALKESGFYHPEVIII
jgi:hypothetical protein